MQNNPRYPAHVGWAIIASIALLFGCHDRENNGNALLLFNDTENADTESPYVVSTSPVPDENDALLTSIITVTFSEPLDCSTVNSSTFTLKESMGVDNFSGDVTCSGTTATFTPAAPLRRGYMYIPEITSNVTDLAGNQLRNSYSWTFFATRAPSQLFHDVAVIPTGAAGAYAVAVGDVNDDGRNDVVLTTGHLSDWFNDCKLKVYLQNAEGGLEQPQVYSLTDMLIEDDVAIGDINNDGKNEVIVANPTDGIRVLSQDGSGGLVVTATYDMNKPGLIRLADMNGDGLLDIVGIYTATRPNKVDIFLQNTNGTLDPARSYDVTYGFFSDLAIGDVNGDGRPDIVIMSGEGNTEICILLQNSDGSYGPTLYYYLSEDASGRDGIVVGDITGDSLADIVYARGANQPNSLLEILYQNPDHTIDSYIIYPSYDCAGIPRISDVNPDGRDDIIVVHDGWYALGVYHKSEDGSLLEEELYEIPKYPSDFHSLDIGDINSDGLPDVVIATWGAGLAVLYHK